jgi:hypothetical protein
MRAGDGADDVEGAVDVGDPVAHRLVERVLERLRARLDRHHLRAEELHAIDVRRLALHVLRAHVHHALHAVAGGDRGGRDAVHPGAGLRDHPGLSHAAREQRLADGVVDLVRAGVVEVLALDVDAGAAAFLGQSFRKIDWARTPDVVLQLMPELGLERRVLARALVGDAQLVERRGERLGDEHAAVRPEMPSGVRQVIHLHCVPLL